MGATAIVLHQSRTKRIARHLGIITGQVTMSSSYATGGDTFDPIPGAVYRNIEVQSDDGYILKADLTAKKLLALVGAAAISLPAVEVANGTNLSAVVAMFTAYVKR